MNVAFCICMWLIKEMGFHDQMVSLTSTITVRINLLALLFRERELSYSSFWNQTSINIWIRTVRHALSDATDYKILDNY